MSEAITLMEQVISKILTNYRIKNIHFANRSLFVSGTSSIDTTCTIWGLETGQVLGRVNLVSGHVKTQLIAHDKEVMASFGCLHCIYLKQQTRKRAFLCVFFCLFLRNLIIQKFNVFKI